jgi:hypothetical protein
LPRYPDLADDRERAHEARAAAAAAVAARRACIRAMREGNTAMVTSAAKAYDTLTSTALKLNGGRAGRPTPLPTEDELRARYAKK